MPKGEEFVKIKKIIKIITCKKWVEKSVLFFVKMVSVDFLPICDLLFNFISVASYFCDVAFDIIVAYTFYRDGLNVWFLITVCSIIISLMVSQTLSIKWFIEDEEQESRSKVTKGLFYTSHFFMCGVLWRYSKLLFLPMGSAIPLGNLA